MKKIKIAQIGIGHDHASAILGSLLRLPDVFEVKGFCVCEGEEEQFEQRKGGVYSRTTQLTLDEILNDPELDAVAVECNEVILTKYTLMAIEKGFHVHMDKPGSESADDFEKLVRNAKAKDLTFHLGYMYRYNPEVIKALEMVKSGKLGKIYSVETHMDCLHSAEKRQWLDTFPGGMLFFLGCHLIDLIVSIQGIPDEIIPLSVSTGLDGVTGKDCGMTVFQYPNGVSFAKTCAAEPGGFARRQLVICGEYGTLELNPLEKHVSTEVDAPNQVTGVRLSIKEDAQKVGWKYQAQYQECEPYNRYDNMMISFAAMVRGEKKNPYTYEYELKLHRILLKACGLNVDYKADCKL